MGKSKSHGKLRNIPPTAPSVMVKRRKSPGGIIKCANDHLVSRRRWNNARRLRQKPSCNECGSTELKMFGNGEIRTCGGGDSERMIWRKKGKMGGKLRGSVK